MLPSIEQDILCVTGTTPLQGSEILQRLNHNRPTPVSSSTVYNALERLEKKGYLDVHWENGRSIGWKSYSIAIAGAETLLAIELYREKLKEGSGH
jgi:DNA-binding PadR family transcriptional regulator